MVLLIYEKSTARLRDHEDLCDTGMNLPWRSACPAFQTLYELLYSVCKEVELLQEAKMVQTTEQGFVEQYSWQGHIGRGHRHLGD